MSEMDSIESLKRTLEALERQTELTRTKLHALIQNTETLSCTAEIYWCGEKQAYITRFIKNHEVIYTTHTKKSNRSMATVGIARADGLKPRVLWKEVDAGKTWRVSAIIHSWYWEKYLNPTTLLAKNVISITGYLKTSSR